MGDSTDVVLQYYTIVSEDQKEVNANKYDQDNSVLYLLNSELKIEDDNQVDEPSTSYESNVKLITLEDGRMFITTTEEHFDTIQPHLLNVDYEEDEAPENDEEITNFKTEEPAIDSDSKYHLLQFSENPKLMKMIYYKTADSKAEIDEVEEEEEKNVRFKCFYEGCEKTYTTSYHLTVHMRSHVNDKPYSCTAEGCSKKFSTNYSLKAHIRTHTGEKPYGCIHCAKHFKTSGDLHKHVRIHTGIKPFMCPIDGCGKSFTTSNIRKVHIRSHTGERPYLCKHPNCGKAFSSSTNYKNHIRIHSGEKPYVCSVEGCDKRFTEYSSLYKHNTVHQQQRPHECTSCGQKFKQKSSLNLHKVFKHKAVMCNDGTEIIIS